MADEYYRPNHDAVATLSGLEAKLQAYHDLALKHSELRARPPVPKKDVQNLKEWRRRHEHAISERVFAYIEDSSHEKDLFALVPRNGSSVRKMLERSRHFREWSIWQVQDDLNDTSIMIGSDDRIDRFVTVLVVTTGLIMLVVPLWILAIYTGPFQRLGIITGFLVAFLIFVSSTNVNKPLESLVAAAA